MHSFKPMVGLLTQNRRIDMENFLGTFSWHNVGREARRLPL